MIMDIHSHTYYSKCGRDDPHAVIDAAIAGGVELFGISDHNHGILDRKREYKKMLDGLKAEYAGKIRLLCGIEIATLPDYFEVDSKDIADFDYCLIENLGAEGSLLGDDPIGFIKALGIPAGIAHTDLFGYCERTDRSPVHFMADMADAGIFWEMNVSYDSIHCYREHSYVKEFFQNAEQQKAVRDAGMCLSVGFDGHRVEDYLPDRVKAACKKVEELGLPFVKL